MATDFERNFFLCTICFKTSETEEECHTLMIPVRGETLVDQERRPLEKDGRLITQAPSWFIAAQNNKTD